MSNTVYSCRKNYEAVFTCLMTTVSYNTDRKYPELCPPTFSLLPTPLIGLYWL